MALIAILVHEQPSAVAERRHLAQKLRFDLIDFLLVATFLGALDQ